MTIYKPPSVRRGECGEPEPWIGKLRLRRCAPLRSTSATFEVSDDDNNLVAAMELTVGYSRHDQTVMRVEGIEVYGTKGQRLGTKLYEEAVALACERGAQFTSDTVRSHFSEAFWRKQQRKGRARCVTENVAGRPGKLYPEPLREMERSLSPEAFEELRAKLPEPHGRNWGCAYYEVKTPCATRDLSGLKRKRKKR